MKIITSCDLGDLGPKEGAAVTYYWNPLYHVVGLLPWLLVAGTFVLLKENRNGASLLIILPVVFAIGCWTIYCKTVTMSASEESAYDVVFTSIIVGFTVFSLLSERFRKIHGFFICLILMGILLSIYISHQALSLGFSRSPGLFWRVYYYFCATVLTVISSMVLSRLFCRRKLTFFRFLFIYTIGLLVFDAIVHAFMPLYYMMWSSSYYWMGWRQFFVFWLEFLLLCFVISIPYLIVLIFNPFWRKRFEAVMGIKTRKVVETIELPEQQTPTSD